MALEDECMQLALTVWGEVPGSLTEEKGEMAGLESPPSEVQRRPHVDCDEPLQAGTFRFVLSAYSW